MNRSLRLSLLSTVFAFGNGLANTADDLPHRLQDTGLYPAGSNATRGDLLSFTPQYPLWSDGTEKRRWIALPPGTIIDASDPDAWQFPRGTKLWKEFSLHGRPLETRFIEHRTDGSWRFAAYVWNSTGTDAVLAPGKGVTLTGVSGAPRGRYSVPSRSDCAVCHHSAPVPVLGFAALQLSSDRDPNAVGARPLRSGDIDLPRLVSKGLIRNLPVRLGHTPPRIPAATPIERAALGSLHGNCAHCHNTSGNRAPLPLTLAQGVNDPLGRYLEVLRSTIGAVSRWRDPHDDSDADAHIIVPGKPSSSVLAIRMQSRHAATQMPPLGTQLPDAESVELIHRWIAHDLTRKEPQP
jgi:hypothetical protein